MSMNTWNNNIINRNMAIKNNEESSYYLDDNLINKFNNLFEKQDPIEIDIWYKY